MMSLAKIRKHLALVFIAATLILGISSLADYTNNYFDQSASDLLLFESESETKLDGSLDHFDFLIPAEFSVNLNSNFSLLFSILFTCLIFSKIKLYSTSPRSPPYLIK